MTFLISHDGTLSGRWLIIDYWSRNILFCKMKQLISRKQFTRKHAKCLLVFFGCHVVKWWKCQSSCSCLISHVNWYHESGPYSHCMGIGFQILAWGSTRVGSPVITGEHCEDIWTAFDWSAKLSQSNYYIPLHRYHVHFCFWLLTVGLLPV